MDSSTFTCRLIECIRLKLPKVLLAVFLDSVRHSLLGMFTAVLGPACQLEHYDGRNYLKDGSKSMTVLVFPNLFALKTIRQC